MVDKPIDAMPMTDVMASIARAIADSGIDPHVVVEIVAASADRDAAIATLRAKRGLTQNEARAVLAMRFEDLTAAGREAAAARVDELSMPAQRSTMTPTSRSVTKPDTPPGCSCCA